MHSSIDKPTVKTRIVILGGGFAGLYSALHFEKTIAADPTVEVTLVSRENFVLFTPMLHEVAAGDLDPSDIVCPLRPMLKRVRFLQADVDGIDLEAREVSLAYGVHGERRVLTYDHLVIALGSETNFFELARRCGTRTHDEIARETRSSCAIRRSGCWKWPVSQTMLSHDAPC